jgi:hypothetical protein
LASQYGTQGGTSYALDLDYQHNEGIRPNNELSRLDWRTTIKQQLTPKDSLFLFVEYFDYHSGDNFQYFDPSAPGVDRSEFHLDETQAPQMLFGYHREWAPGIHTLLLAGRLVDDQRESDKNAFQRLVLKNFSEVVDTGVYPMDFQYRFRPELYTAELSQIFEAERQTLVFGGRFQSGRFHTTDLMTVTNQTEEFVNPLANDDFHDSFQRVTGYGYYTAEPLDHLFLTGGVCYDWLIYPKNFRAPPVTGGTVSRSQLGPKAAIVWSPRPEVTLRGVYTRSLGGASLDQSVRLEPTQLAGFIQTYRSIMPESVVGETSGAAFETAGAALDLKLRTRTYVGLEAQLLNSDLQRSLGSFILTDVFRPYQTPEQLDYKESSISATVDQLVSDDWSFGLRYRYSRAQLHNHFVQIPTSADTNADNVATSDLHTAQAYALFNHPSGFFARAELNWYLQYNWVRTSMITSYPETAHVTVDKPGDEFPQLNFFVGYRFRRQLGDLTFGLLNATGGDYHLNPLNVYTELPRSRVWSVRVRISI